MPAAYEFVGQQRSDVPETIVDALIAILLLSRENGDVLAAAVCTEANEKLLLASSADPTILTNVSTDIGSLLKAWMIGTELRYRKCGERH
ncbi:hypothetical protein HH110_11895 [Stenotrophomonas sp. SAM-B]|uniref:hypothetical protein n=1 Tax=Stenotrophomonas TaxID=40323 RepID=UPI0015A2F5DD|nr:hypothetical protein [Stenotrophomonas sp. SAM-B]NWF33739.1 hypothetical protein [Stenotrophomonas sp. SAM-B]